MSGNLSLDYGSLGIVGSYLSKGECRTLDRAVAEIEYPHNSVDVPRTLSEAAQKERNRDWADVLRRLPSDGFCRSRLNELKFCRGILPKSFQQKALTGEHYKCAAENVGCLGDREWKCLERREVPRGSRLGPHLTLLVQQIRRVKAIHIVRFFSAIQACVDRENLRSLLERKLPITEKAHSICLWADQPEVKEKLIESGYLKDLERLGVFESPDSLVQRVQEDTLEYVERNRPLLTAADKVELVQKRLFTPKPFKDKPAPSKIEDLEGLEEMAQIIRARDADNLIDFYQRNMHLIRPAFAAPANAIYLEELDAILEDRAINPIRVAKELKEWLKRPEVATIWRTIEREEMTGIGPHWSLRKSFAQGHFDQATEENLLVQHFLEECFGFLEIGAEHLMRERSASVWESRFNSLEIQSVKYINLIRELVRNNKLPREYLLDALALAARHDQGFEVAVQILNEILLPQEPLRFIDAVQEMQKKKFVDNEIVAALLEVVVTKKDPELWREFSRTMPVDFSKVSKKTIGYLWIKGCRDEAVLKAVKAVNQYDPDRDFGLVIHNYLSSGNTKWTALIDPQDVTDGMAIHILSRVDCWERLPKFSHHVNQMSSDLVCSEFTKLRPIQKALLAKKLSFAHLNQLYQRDLIPLRDLSIACFSSSNLRKEVAYLIPGMMLITVTVASHFSKSPNYLFAVETGLLALRIACTQAV